VITPVRMPQLGLETSEGVVAEILVSVGDQIAAGGALLVLTTDKADADVVAPRAGFITAIAVDTEEVVVVGQILVYIGDTADEAIEAEVDASDSGAAKEHSVARSAGLGLPRDGAAAGRQRRAAPVARRAAQTLGVDLGTVHGTGPQGRITLRDVEAAADSRGASSDAVADDSSSVGRGHVSTAGEFEEFAPLRRAVARRMTASQQIPQFQLVRDIDASHLIARKEAEITRIGAAARVGINDLLIQAVAETVMQHRVLAAVYEEAPDGVPGMRVRATADVGLAVATNAGLIVPVIRRAHELGLQEIAGARNELIRRAREGSLGLDALSGGVITLSNLGAFGVDHFTAMVNPGESAIVAVGRVSERVAPRGRGLAVVPTLRLTATFDHRVVDGAEGAAALSTLTDLLEGAMQWRP
jgi:pyruvate dehydrogenase E2 component (dihydrolipoamide acetyltransferase)